MVSNPSSVPFGLDFVQGSVTFIHSFIHLTEQSFWWSCSNSSLYVKQLRLSNARLACETRDIIEATMTARDDVIKCKHFPRYWPFVWGIHRWPVNSPYKGQWRGALMYSLICACIDGWVNDSEVGDLRRHRTHYNVTVMRIFYCGSPQTTL